MGVGVGVITTASFSLTICALYEVFHAGSAGMPAVGLLKGGICLCTEWMT